MASRFLGREILLWTSLAAFGLQLVERLSVLIAVSPYVRWLTTHWSVWMQVVSHWTLMIAKTHMQSSVSPFFAMLTPLVIQLAVIVAFAFAYFGLEPYWVRSSRSTPGPGLAGRYLIHFSACIILFALLVYTSSALGAQASSVFDLRAIHALAGLMVLPASPIDLLVGGVFSALATILLVWHPGIAVRVLLLVVALELVSQLAFVVPYVYRLLESPR